MTPLDEQASELARSACDVRHWGAAALAMLGARGRCRLAANPHWTQQDSDWAQTATHWSCEVRTPFGSATTNYSLGAAYRGRAATALEVLLGLAESRSMLSSHPTAQDLIDEGFVDSGEEGPHAAAERLMSANRRAGAQFERLAGPFADACEPHEASAAARAYCLAHPDRIQPGKGRPFGLAEIAAALGDARLLAERFSAGDCGPERAARLGALAEAFGHPELALMAAAMGERAALCAHAAAGERRAPSRPASL